MQSMPNILSHQRKPDPLKLAVARCRAMIKARGTSLNGKAAEMMHWLEELQKFALGQFLLVHRGLNGFWTYHLNTVHPKISNPLRDRQYQQSPLARFLYETSPNAVARQERFNYVLQLNQNSLVNNAKIASIPSGFMGDLLHLDYTGIQNVQIIGVDFDMALLQGACHLARSRGLAGRTKLHHLDAWQLPFRNEFTLISSHGLNVYVQDEAMYRQLYENFFAALKPGGQLVTSFLTPPPDVDPDSPWNAHVIDTQALRMQRIIFGDLIGIQFNVYRQPQAMVKMLQEIGYVDVQIVYDSGCVFPTLICRKR